MKRFLELMAVLFFATFTYAQAPYVTLTGTIQGPNGIVAANDILNFTPSQTFFVAGATPLVVAPVSAECATSVDGTVVLLPNPLNPPLGAPAFTGTLGSGTYYIVIVWYDAAGHFSLPSPEIQISLVSTGQLQISPPAAGMPSTALGMRVYISATSGTETYQGNTTGSATFIQSVPLVAGVALPTSNNSVCQLIANDAGWPTGTGYYVTMTTPSGATMPGYPMQWQLLGPGNTINLGQGLPLYNGIVTYPSPILASPYNHGPQSISGPLSMTGYNVYNVGALGVGTALPAWGVDVEGSGNPSRVNANGGYLVNGSGGSSGQCLGSDGTAYDTPIACLTSVFYQTIDLNGTAQTQRPALNFSSLFTASDSASPARTNIGLNAPGTGTLVATYGSAPSTSTALVAFDGNGNLIPATTGASFNAPQVATLGGNTTFTSNNVQQTMVTESVTFPSAAGTYRALVGYVMYVTTGGNVCNTAVVDSTHNVIMAAVGANNQAGGGGFAGFSTSDLSSQTYAAGSSATFNLVLVCNGNNVPVTVNPYVNATLVPTSSTHISVTPVLSN